jgi:signal transduction histidine kinase
VPPEVREAQARIAGTDTIHIAPVNVDTLAGYASISDITGQPVAALRVLSPRAVFQQGVATAWTFVLLFLIAGAFTMATLLVLLHRIAVNPIVRLREHVKAIAETKDLSRQFTARTNDEVGSLADAFNDMARNLDAAQSELKDTHQKLMVAAREAGMAEVASGVLHNVGNVLNSVNTCVAMMRKQAGESRIENLGKTLDLIEERKEDLAEFLTRDERGQKVLPYLRCLAERLSEEHNETATILGNLTRHIEHIIEIVSLQQSVAKSASVIEPVMLNEVIADATAICSESLTRHQVELVIECADLPPVCLDRHQVLQILVNLISNAKQAASAGGNGHGKRVAVRLHPLDSDTVRIEVSDNGIGIRKEDMTRIFAHGFTTRKDGHGFGLHSAALAAQQLGGSIEAASDGAGQGATFTLTLPFRTEGRSHRGLD